MQLPYFKLVCTDINDFSSALEDLTWAGFYVFCADGFYRQCHPIIAGFMVNYEEQVLITGIKSNNHCSICQVPPDKRENLHEKWELRTHESTQSQILRQLKQLKLGQRDTMAMHAVNIHLVIMVNILHQLLKDIVKWLLDWTEDLMKELTGNSTKDKSACGVKQKQGRKLVKDLLYSIWLDEQFWQVPSFHDLKRFPDFSKV